MGCTQSNIMQNQQSVDMFKNESVDRTFCHVDDGLSALACAVAQLSEKMSFHLSNHFTKEEREEFRRLEKRKRMIIDQIEFFVSALQIKYEDVLELLQNPVATTDLKTQRIKRCFDGSSLEKAQPFITSISTLSQDYQNFRDDLNKTYRMKEVGMFLAKSLICLFCIAGVVAVFTHCFFNPFAAPAVYQAGIWFAVVAGIAGVNALTKDEVQRGIEFLNNTEHSLEQLKKSMQEMRDLVHKGIIRTKREDFESLEPDFSKLFQMLIEKCNKVKELARNC